MADYDREHLAAVLESLPRGVGDPAVIEAAREYFDRTKNEVPFARITRVRIEGFGADPHTVQYTLYDHAKHFAGILGETCVSWGEVVLERDLNYTEASDFGWKGRLILHVDPSGGRSG